MQNLFYFSHLNIIGGIEQFFAYLAERYREYDITIVYRSADAKQLRRLRKYVRCVQFKGQMFECNKAFFCFNRDIRSYIKAKEYNLILHGDYKTMIEQNMLDTTNPIFTEHFDNYYGVSKLVCDSWEELTGKKCEVIYNPFIQASQKHILKLVYCGRLTSEKGGDLCEKLLKRLKERKVDYMLYVYSDKQTFGDDNVVYLNTRLDAGQFLNKDNFDYILITSKNEGYCYSLVQALANGLPAVATPCPVFKELGVNAKNSISLDFDGENVDDVIDKMLTKTLKFEYIPKADSWDKVLAKGSSTYTPHEVTIKTIRAYFDTELQADVACGYEYEVDEERAELIVNKGFATIIRSL